MRRSFLSSIPIGAVACAALLLALEGQPLVAQQPPDLPPPNQALAPDQLDDLVAPIALYPDPLVSQILRPAFPTGWFRKLSPRPPPRICLRRVRSLNRSTATTSEC